MLGRSIGSVLDQCAQNFGSREAMVDGDQRWTYRDYFAQLRRTGRALRALGLADGDRVAIICSDRREVIDVYYGAMWAGLATVPLNPRMSLDDHSYVLGNTGARVVLFDAATAERVESLHAQGAVEIPLAAEPAALFSGATLLSDLTAQASGALGAPPVDPGRPALIAHTGGTTGRPKGVTHTHSTALAALYSLAYEADWQRDERVFHATPLAHAGGIMFLPTWLKGAANHLMGGFDPERLLEAIERERLTASLLIPTMIYMMLDAPGAKTRDMSSLRAVLYGGAPMAKERLLEAVEMWGSGGFLQLYGQAEAPGQITILGRDTHIKALAEDDDAMLRSCGWPVLVAEVMVADDDMRPVVHGEAGEICVKGPHVMKGYWNDPEETALSLRDGWLRTGDIGSYDPERGVYTLLDRKKDMIISGGYNVYPAQVEKAMFAHPGVADVCVIGVPDAKWGEAVKAIVVRAKGDAPSQQELIDFTQARAGRWLTPKTIDFVDTIPLTASNKPDKKALRATYWEGHDRAIN